MLNIFHQTPVSWRVSGRYSFQSADPQLKVGNPILLGPVHIGRLLTLNHREAIRTASLVRALAGQAGGQ